MVLSMYYIYILYSENYDCYCIGYINDENPSLEEQNTNPRMT